MSNNVISSFSALIQNRIVEVAALSHSEHCSVSTLLVRLSSLPTTVAGVRAKLKKEALALENAKHSGNAKRELASLQAAFSSMIKMAK